MAATRAVVISRFGGPEVLELATWPDPVPRPGEAVVRILACALNRMDVLGRAAPGAPYTHTPHLPHIPGGDLCGEVESVADPADADWVGRRVVAYGAVTCGRCDACRDGAEVNCASYALLGEHLPGALAERIALPVRNLLEVPQTSDPAAAACLNAAYTTAINMVECAGPVGGRWVCVVGAAGGVGAACVQLGALFGATVVAVTRAPEKADRLRALGAGHVVVAPPGAFADAVLALRPRGVDLVANTVGGEAWHDGVACLTAGGTMALCGAHAGDAPTVSLRQLYQRRRRVVGAPFGTFAQFRRVVELFASGALIPAVDRVFPLADVADAHRHLEATAQVGKVVVRVS